MEKEIIHSLGFNYDDQKEVRGRLSISDLFPVSRGRCSIYLLKYADQTYYIGQAVDAVRRFSQHRKNYDNITHY